MRTRTAGTLRMTAGSFRRDERGGKRRGCFFAMRGMGVDEGGIEEGLSDGGGFSVQDLLGSTDSGFDGMFGEALISNPVRVSLIPA